MMLQKIGILLLTVILLSGCMTKQIDTPLETTSETNLIQSEKETSSTNLSEEDETLKEFEDTLIELLESTD